MGAHQRDTATRFPAAAAAPSDPAGSGPTVLRMALGGRLRALRERAGVTREAAGDAIRASAAKISRVELGGSASRSATSPISSARTA